jgi:glutaredoxin 3
MAVTVTIYTRAWCGYCTAAKELLDAKGVAYTEIDTEADPELRKWLIKTTGRRTVPQVFIDDKPVGGYTDIRALDYRGELDRLLAGTTTPPPAVS